MNKLVSNIEKLKPFFEKVSRNRYLRAIRDGFISAMPIVLFSSIFMLLAYVPNIFGFYWSKEIEAMILKPYNYSMGILALVVAGTTAKNLADNFNRDMPVNRQINNISALMAAIVWFLDCWGRFDRRRVCKWLYGVKRVINSLFSCLCRL